MQNRGKTGRKKGENRGKTGGKQGENRAKTGRKNGEGKKTYYMKILYEGENGIKEGGRRRRSNKRVEFLKFSFHLFFTFF